MKTKTKHTPGPWAVNYNSTTEGVAEVYTQAKVGHNFTLAFCVQGEASTSGQRGKYIVSKEEMLANARLIATAPELLEALESALRVMESVAQTHDYDTSVGVVPQVRAAIAKARGN